MIAKEEAMLIKQEILDNWMSEDGLLCLDPVNNEGERPPHGEAEFRTAQNDNGLLFVTEFYYLCSIHGILTDSDKSRFESTMKLLTKKTGLYHKNPGRVWRNSTHDDYIGIVSGSILFGTNHAKEVEDYGSKNFYYYNNTTDNKFRFKYFRQGSDVAFYKICAGKIPNPISYLWMAIRILLSSKTKIDSNDSGRMLSWLKLRAMEKAFDKENLPFYLKLLKNINNKIKNKFLELIKPSFKNVGEIIQSYYTPNWPMPFHPIKKLAEGVKF